MIALAAVVAALAAASPAPVPSSTPSSIMQTPYWRVETTAINQKGNGDFTMPEKVTFARPGSDGTSDRAEGNSQRGTVSLIGNVVIHDNGSAEEAQEDPEYAKGGPSTLTCDRLDVDAKARVYTAIGNVKYTQGDRSMTSDHATLDRQLHKILLSGHVYAANGDAHMRADSVRYDTVSKAFEVVGSPMSIVQPVPTRAPGASPEPSGSPAPKRKRR
ncbi:MAG: LPS export ABC transporter periplasmic protein LptC [Candidatus Eremiobacteraeota bacterium]|nr:LPS export ABC transporter periplasmic protein LptC [Candidatus Eremiobacteraeota bacterium]